jgi:hypothetical protein
LTLSELGAAIGIERSTSTSYSYEKVVKDQVEYCGSFLELQNKNEVSLIHQSAKDYLLRKTEDSDPKLESFRVRGDVGNLEVARKCLDYLQDDALADGALKEVGQGRNSMRIKRFPLLPYAALHWPERARACSLLAKELLDLSLPFFQKESILRSKWSSFYSEGRESPPSGLLRIASYFGIIGWV